MKRILAWTLSILMIFNLFTINVSAASTASNVYLLGEQLKTELYYYYDGGTLKSSSSKPASDKWLYMSNTSTVKLHNFEASGAVKSKYTYSTTDRFTVLDLHETQNAVMILEGENRLTCDPNAYTGNTGTNQKKWYAAIIQVTSNSRTLTIKNGDTPGTLYVTGGDVGNTKHLSTAGMYICDLTVESGIVYATGGNGYMSRGIALLYGMTVTGGEVYAKGGDATPGHSSAGIATDNKGLTITNGAVYAEAGKTTKGTSDTAADYGKSAGVIIAGNVNINSDGMLYTYADTSANGSNGVLLRNTTSVVNVNSGGVGVFLNEGKYPSVAYPGNATVGSNVTKANNTLVVQNNIGTVRGTVTLTHDLDLPKITVSGTGSSTDYTDRNINITGDRLVIAEGVTLTIPQNTIINNNKVIENNGTIINNGTINNDGVVINNAGSTVDNNGTWSNVSTSDVYVEWGCNFDENISGAHVYYGIYNETGKTVTGTTSYDGKTYAVAGTTITVSSDKNFKLNTEPAVAVTNPNSTTQSFSMPKASVKLTANEYCTVIWVDENGTPLYEADFEYGATPVFGGTTPVKVSDSTNHYEFDGWDKDYVAVNGDTTYTATYKATAHDYSCSVIKEEYKVSDSTPDCEHGTRYYKSCECGYASTTETFYDDTDKLNHDYIFVGFTWTEGEDGADPTAVANFKCSRNDSHTTTIDATVTQKDSTDGDCITESTKIFTAAYGTHTEDKTFSGDKGTHKLTKVEAVGATCTEDGNNEYYKCTVCDTLYTDETAQKETTIDAVTISALGHDWTKSDGTVNAVFDWNEEGTYCTVTFACKRDCEEKHSNIESKLTAKVEANCLTQESKTYTVNVTTSDNKAKATDTKTVYGEFGGHTLGTWTNEDPATCTENGTKGHYTCSVCQKYFDGEHKEITDLSILAHGHEYAEASFTWDETLPAGEAPKCTAKQVCEYDSTHTIEYSADKVTVELFEDAEHPYIHESCDTEGEVYYIATVIGDGNITYTSQTQGFIIPALSHYDTNRDGKCDRLTAAGTTCDKQICIHTDENYTIKNKLAATCTEEGYTGDKFCLKCSSIRELGEVIPATGHAYKVTEVVWTENYTRSTPTCNVTFVCQNDNTHSGTVEGTVTLIEDASTVPTCTENGIKYYGVSAVYDGVVFDHNNSMGRTDYKKSYITEKSGHDFTVSYNWVNDGSACTVTFTCTAGCIYTVTKKLAENEISSQQGTLPTCEDMGSTKYSVSGTYTDENGEEWNYNDTLEVYDVAAKGHDFTGAYNKLDGEHNFACKNGCGGYGIGSQINGTVECKYTVKTNNNGTHTAVCECGNNYTEYCSGGNATCIAQAVCDICNTAYGDFEAHIFAGAVNTLDGMKHNFACIQDGCEAKGIDGVEDAFVDCHGFVLIDKKDSTCTENGYEKYKCGICDNTKIDVLDATGHTEGEKVTTKEATCTESGAYTVYCAVCEEIIATVTTTALGHSLVTVSAQTPTCSQIGWAEYVYCTVCDYTTYEEIAKTAHSYTSVVTPPTCVAMGYTTYTCTECGDSYTADETETGDHTVVEIPAIEPTCTTAGSTGGTMCSVCGEIFVSSTVIDILGHDLGAGVVETAPTCTTAGVKKFSCSRCDYILTVSVPALNHTMVIDEAVAPTCSSTGLTEGLHCSECGKVFVDQETVEMIEHTRVEISAVAPTCTTVGSTAGIKCLVCGEVLDAPEEIPATGIHNYEWQTVTAATCLATGIAKEVCSVCDAEGETAEIPVTETHRDYYVLNAVAPTYDADGYTGDKYCVDCGDLIEEGTVIPKLTNSDSDLIGCTCICHNNNVVIRTLYQILNFFFKLFRIHQQCACGVYHW